MKGAIVWFIRVYSRAHVDNASGMHDNTITENKEPDMPRNTIQLPLAVLDDDQIEQLIIHLLEVKRDFESEDDLVEYANELDEPITKLTNEIKQRKYAIVTMPSIN